MKKRVITAAPDTPIKDVAHLMADKKIGCVPVVSDGALVGPSDDNRYSHATSKHWLSDVSFAVGDEIPRMAFSRHSISAQA